jgi:hypothetical protein
MVAMKRPAASPECSPPLKRETPAMDRPAADDDPPVKQTLSDDQDMSDPAEPEPLPIPDGPPTGSLEDCCS